MSGFYFKFFVFFFMTSIGFLHAQNKDTPFVVVLDAGHGGKDSGNNGNGFLEKKIALNTTLAIGALLQKERGIRVLYTRDTDRYIELKNRAKVANEADADLFVSIHCDAFQSPKAYGAGTFVLGLHRTDDNFRIAQKENSVIFLEEDYQTTYDGFDPNNPESVISLVLMQEAYLGQSIEAASYIQKSFVQNLSRKDRTVKQAGFLVLRETYMPSVLVELGFLTNKKEGAYLNSAKGQKQMATAISKAILNYKNQLDNAVSNSVRVEALISKEKTAITEKESSAAAPVRATSSGVVFKVQIAASSRKIDPSPVNFKGLSNISIEQSKALFRYYYGATSSYKTAKKLKKQALKKGYKNAFLVSFKNGRKIKLSEAISAQ